MRDGWRLTTLGEVADVYGGGTPSTKNADFWGGGVAWITPTEVVAQDGDVITRTERTITARGLKGSGARLLPARSVLVTSRATVGAVALSGLPIAINQGFAGIVCRQNVLPEWLMLWCQANRDEFRSRAGGSTFPEVSRPAVRTIPLQLPPPREQRRIVDLFSSLTWAERAALEEARAAADVYRLLRDTLIWDPVTPRRPLAAVASIRASLVSPTDERYLDLPHIGIERMVTGEGALLPLRSARSDRVISPKFLFSAADVIYAKIRPELRKVARPGFQGLCSADAYPLLPASAVDPEFLLHLLLSEGFTKQAVARSGRSKMPKVNRRELLAIEVPVPDGDIQFRLARQCRALLHVSDAARAEAVEIARARGALSDRLFSGEDTLPESYDRFLEPGP